MLGRLRASTARSVIERRSPSHVRSQHDHDTVVVSDGGSSTGLILGIIAVIIVLAGAWYFLMGPGANTTHAPTDVNVERRRSRASPPRPPRSTTRPCVRRASAGVPDVTCRAMSVTMAPTQEVPE